MRSGSFFFSLNDVSLAPNGAAALTRRIKGASETSAVPEPAALLRGTGLLGAAARALRRLSRGPS